MMNLDKYVQKVWKAETLDKKRTAFKELLAVSHAKTETKVKALREIQTMSAKRLDSFASNYAFAGYKMKVK